MAGPKRGSPERPPALQEPGANGSASSEFDFQALAGLTCGVLLPTGQARDLIDGIWVTCIDFGEPHVLVCGSGGVGGKREQDQRAKDDICLERLRLQAGYLMGMGNRAGQALPRLLHLYRFDPIGTPVNAPAIAVLPQDTARQFMLNAGSAAALAVACTLADTVAHECCPLPPLPTDASTGSELVNKVPEQTATGWTLTVVNDVATTGEFRPAGMAVQLVEVTPHCVLRVTMA